MASDQKDSTAIRNIRFHSASIYQYIESNSQVSMLTIAIFNPYDIARIFRMPYIIIICKIFLFIFLLQSYTDLCYSRMRPRRASLLVGILPSGAADR